MKKVIVVSLLILLLFFAMILAIAERSKASENMTNYSSSCSFSSAYKEEYDNDDTINKISEIAKQLYTSSYAEIVFAISAYEKIDVAVVITKINKIDKHIMDTHKNVSVYTIMQAYLDNYDITYLDWLNLKEENISIATNKKYEEEKGIKETKANYYLRVMNAIYEDCSMNTDGLPADKPYTITGWFPTYNQNGTGDKHYGIDLGLALNTPLYAVADSEVILASQQCDNNGYLGNVCGGYGITGGGNYVILKVTDGSDYYMVSYSHMSTVEVNKGDHVVKGQKIGTSGNSGNTTGPHLHFEIHKNVSYYELGNDKGIINPCEYVTGLCESDKK